MVDVFFTQSASILYYEKNPTKLKNPRFTFERINENKEKSSKMVEG